MLSPPSSDREMCVYFGAVVCYELVWGKTGYSGECCFGVMYVEWYGVCDFVVFSVVDICVSYSSVYVFHVCFDLCIVYWFGEAAWCPHVCY